VILAVTVVRFEHGYTAADWDERWALRQLLIGVGLALATAHVAGRWVPQVVIGQLVVWVWGFGLVYALDARATGDPMVYTPTLSSCEVDASTRLYGCPMDMVAMGGFRARALREAWWYDAQLLAHVLGPPPNAYTGPLLAEADAVALSKRAVPVPFSVAGVVALFANADLAGAAWFNFDHWRDAQRLAGASVGDTGVLLSWDDGRTIDLYDRDSVRLVATWSPGRPPCPAPSIGEAFYGPIPLPTLADIALRRRLERRAHQANALWLRRRWLHEARSATEVAALIQHLHAHEITAIYPFIGPMRPGGRFGWRDGDVLREYDADTARKFFARAHAAASADGSELPLKILPWTGGVLGKDVHLDDAGWRAAFVVQAKALVDLGADGLQLNIEPMPAFTDGYLALLGELRASLGPAAIIGVAAYPPPTPLHPYPDVHWSLDFLKAVCEAADDVAVMAYDTALPTTEAYTALVREWTTEIGSELPSAEDAGGCTWRMGVPDYDDDAPWHRPEAETLRAALDGIPQNGDGLPLDARSPDGIAVYASWTTEPVEWATLDLRWRRAAPLDVEWIDGPQGAKARRRHSRRPAREGRGDAAPLRAEGHAGQGPRARPRIYAGLDVVA
jgi:hypothetical protein